MLVDVLRVEEPRQLCLHVREDARLEVDQQRAWDVLLVVGLVEEDILAVAALRGKILEDAVLVDPVLEAQLLPELHADLIAALADLQRDDLARLRARERCTHQWHTREAGVSGRESGVVPWSRRRRQPGREHREGATLWEGRRDVYTDKFESNKCIRWRQEERRDAHRIFHEHHTTRSHITDAHHKTSTSSSEYARRLCAST
eukprot:6377621-Prymnesium_polylepis.2